MAVAVRDREEDVKRAVREMLVRVQSGEAKLIANVLASLADYTIDAFNKVFDRFSEVTEKLEEHGKRLSRIELHLGALTESTYSKFILDDLRRELESRGEKLLSWERNAVVGGEEIDLLVETDKTVYVVEVKVKPGIGDVGALLAKSELVAKLKPGKTVKPILAGALVGSEVRSYATQKGVEVYSY